MLEDISFKNLKAPAIKKILSLYDRGVPIGDIAELTKTNRQSAYAVVKMFQLIKKEGK